MQQAPRHSAKRKEQRVLKKKKTEKGWKKEAQLGLEGYVRVLVFVSLRANAGGESKKNA